MRTRQGWGVCWKWVQGRLWRQRDVGAWQRLEGLSEADGAQMVFGVGQVVQWVFDVGRWEAGVGRGGAVGVGRVAEMWAGVADGWEIFVIGVGCANRHFILRRICGKSPVGANAGEPHLSDGWLSVLIFL